MVFGGPYFQKRCIDLVYIHNFGLHVAYARLCRDGGIARSHRARGTLPGRPSGSCGAGDAPAQQGALRSG